VPNYLHLEGNVHERKVAACTLSRNRNKLHRNVSLWSRDPEKWALPQDWEDRYDSMSFTAIVKERNSSAEQWHYARSMYPEVAYCPPQPLWKQHDYCCWGDNHRDTRVVTWIAHCYTIGGRLQCPRGLRHELSSSAQTLGTWVRMPFDSFVSASVYVALRIGKGL
jgi:hypothetical protein